MKRVLCVRQDNNGDVLLSGPAIRAVAAKASVTLLCGPRGFAAASALADVERVIVAEAGWIDAQPRAVRSGDVLRVVAELNAQAFDEAIVFTSFHQSPLPIALILRMANIRRIGAISVDYPGSLLDVRHSVEDDVHEVKRALSLAAAMGYELPPQDDARLRIRYDDAIAAPFSEYVVVHPGATVPARAWFPERNRELVSALSALGFNVVVTGTQDEAPLAQYVAGGSPAAFNAAGMTTFESFAGVLRRATAVVCGNTAAAHVAAAVQTPVISIFAPTIPASRFRPWKVPHAILGDQRAPCAGCRARICPVEGQPCVAVVAVTDVVDAIRSLSGAREAVA